MSLLKCRFINDHTKAQSVLFVLKRFKSKKTLEKNLPTNRALSHFDDFYKSLFGERWPSVRLALLSKPKQVAVINNFGNINKTEEFFQNQGALDLRSMLEVQKNFTQQADPVECSKQNDGPDLEEIITEHLQSEEKKETEFFHPKGMEFKLKADSVTEKNDENENQDYVYKPEDARTSLDFDINTAEFDKTRLIMPDSQMQETNLKEFIPVTKLRGVDEFIPESEYYRYYQSKMQTPVVVEDEHEIEFPEKLKVYTFDRGDVSEFPDPPRSVTNVYDYLKIDGGELLAALALGVQPNDAVLDLCASSGNIAYCILQTLRPKFLVCSKDKDGIVRDLFSEYLLDFSLSGNNMLHVTRHSIENLDTDYLFDKVLVNVPSTEDKYSLFETEDNIFHLLRTRNRLRLPEVQCQFLIQGLKLVRPGGTVLYTSSTLSPVQNDGVVNKALHLLWEDCKQEFVIKNLSPALRHTSGFFNYGDYLNLKFGTLIVPFVPMNFGPRYFCKIVKKGEDNTSTISQEEDS